MITSISWKNVWRNRSRSLVVIIAITLGTIAGIFVAGLMNGWVNQRINAAIYTEVGHLKVQNPKFLVNEEAKHSINNYSKIEAYLNNLKEVKAWSARSKIMAMASTARGNSGLILKGIDPEKDKLVSDVFDNILPNTGTYFESKARLPQILISNKTAQQLKIKNYRIKDITIDSLKKLEIPIESINKLEPISNKRFITKKKFETAIKEVWTKTEIRKYAPALLNTSAYFQPRAKITCSFTKTNGELGYQTYQVCGVYKTSNTMFDQMSAFVKHADLVPAALLAENQFHEISVIINDLDNLESVTKEIQEKYSEASVMNWKQLAPDAGMMSEFMTIYYYIIMGIIFFALAFGIINTMLMAILERVKELGMLMAIGMKKGKVFSMIMLETIFLTLTGSIIGMVLGALLIKITGKTGLNFSSVAEGFESFGWSSHVYPSIETSFFFGVTIMVIVIAIIASLVPARKALKLKPIEALRME